MTDKTQALLPVTPEDKSFAKTIAQAVMAWGAPHFKHMVSFNVLCEAIEPVIAANRISHSLPGDVGRSEWMNLMPREVVARAALGEGCRDETADNIRYGFHRDVKIRAEVAVKLVASIQDDVRAALTPSPCPGDGK